MACILIAWAFASNAYGAARELPRTILALYDSTYDKAITADLTQASAVMAVAAYELANLSGMIPRGERTPATPVQAVKVSDSLLVRGTR